MVAAFSFRSVCGQSQSGREWAEGCRVLQKGETLLTPVAPLAGRLDRESFFFPRAPRQAIDSPCPDQWLAVTLHDPYQHYKNQCRCSDVYLFAHSAGAESRCVQALLRRACILISPFKRLFLFLFPFNVKEPAIDTLFHLNPSFSNKCSLHNVITTEQWHYQCLHWFLINLCHGAWNHPGKRRLTGNTVRLAGWQNITV